MAAYSGWGVDCGSWAEFVCRMQFFLGESYNTYTYIVICSGRQNRDDGGVVVDKMYMDENAIYIESVLRQTATPSDAVSKDTVSYPYIVLRIARTTSPVVFKN